MKPYPTETISELAQRFCAILKAWLTPEELSESVKRNAIAAAIGDHSVCHSHDFCDANQAMLDAWEECFGKDEYPAVIRGGATEEEIDRDDQLWNRAWSLAKQSEFSICVF